MSVIGASFNGRMYMVVSSLKLLRDASAVVMLLCLGAHVMAVLALSLFCPAMSGNVSIRQTLRRE